MKEVILHIGMSKTGTTSIQDSLHGIDRDGFRTVSFKEKNHSVPLYTMFSKKRYDYHIWKKQGFSNDQIDKKRDEYTKIFQEDLADESVNVFLISGEGISGLSEDEQQTLCCFLKEKKFKVKIIYVVRDPFAWAVSANQQHAKGGAKAISKVKPLYKKRIQGFIKECGQENILVYRYEDLIKKGLIKSFSEIIGVKLEEKAPLNKSMTSEALALLYVFNNIKVSTKGTKVRFQARQAIVKALMNFFSKSNGFGKINLEQLNLVHDSVEKDLVWLEECFGITYPNPFREKSEGSDFDAVPDSKIISKFFERNFLSYESSLSLSENFQNLYIKFLSFHQTNEKLDIIIRQERWPDAMQTIIKAIELGDELHSLYRKASNISNRLKETDDAIVYARQAVDAKDNNDVSRANHKEHLVNLLRIAGKFDDALIFVDELLQSEENRFSAYTAKANILLGMQQVEEAKATIQRSIELGDERHSAYRQASNISNRLKETDDAIFYARQAIDAKDNNDVSRANHKEHLVNLLRIAGKFDDALVGSPQKTKKNRTLSRL